MADDHTQRPTRSSQPPVRPASAAPTGNDPLAELARLIGQNDPFAEFGRDGAHTAPFADAHAGYAQAPAHGYADERYVDAHGHVGQHHAAAPPPMPAAPFPLPEAYPPPHAHQGYAEAPYAPADMHAPGVIPGHGGYEQGPYYPNNPPSGAEDQDFYDDAPPRRRLGILIVAAVFALAVIGTAGAFGYRALFGVSGHRGPPPIIKADSSPSKIVPAAASKDPKSSKLIYDRVNNGGQNEKLVSREEQPVDIKDKPVGAVLQQSQNCSPAGAMQPMLGSGVIGVDPKKIHTIAIHPDQMANATQGTAPALAPASAKPGVPSSSPPPRTSAEPAPHRMVAHAEPMHHAAALSNAPLSLNPNAPEPPAHAAQRVMRTAAVAAPTQIAPSRTAAPARSAPGRSSRPTPTSLASASGGGGYAVQIVSRRSEADAQASFHSLQARHPQQLGGRAPLIRRVDLGAKGVYYRAMVGPFGSAEKANELCSSMKAAGGQCIVQKI